MEGWLTINNLVKELLIVLTIDVITCNYRELPVLMRHFHHLPKTIHVNDAHTRSTSIFFDAIIHMFSFLYSLIENIYMYMYTYMSM